MTIQRDITNVLPSIIKVGQLAIMEIISSRMYSRTKMRKLGLIHNPWKPKLGWKHR